MRGEEREKEGRIGEEQIGWRERGGRRREEERGRPDKGTSPNSSFTIHTPDVYMLFGVFVFYVVFWGGRVERVIYKEGKRERQKARKKHT